MPKENKKELIIREALKLFSEKGFAAVSMRDLAESVGISVSTIYHYYESKQALVRDMITRANELTAKARDSFFRILSGTEKVECEPFVRAGVMYVTAYLRHEQIDPLLRMLESERFHEPAAEEAREGYAVVKKDTALYKEATGSKQVAEIKKDAVIYAKDIIEPLLI